MASSLRPEPLFQVMFHAGSQPVGGPMTAGSGRLRIEITPTQMMRLHQELSSRAIHALMLVLEHGYRPGKRIEIDGWSGRWLIEQGMARTTAEKAAKELTEKGYIRSERLPGATSPLGRKLGVVPSGVVEEVEDVPGIPRTDGRPAGAVSANYRNEADLVDNPVSVDGRNGVTPERRTGDQVATNTQVSPVPSLSRNGFSTAPSSSKKEEESSFFLPGRGHPLTRHDLTRFFAQPELSSQLQGSWEVSVALLAATFRDRPVRCGELVTWLGDTHHTAPDNGLAQILVDLLITQGTERFTAVADLGTYLTARGVKYRPCPPDEFIGMFVSTSVSSLDSTRNIGSWAGWYGGGLKRDDQFQGPILAAALGVLGNVLAHGSNAVEHRAVGGETLTGNTPALAAGPSALPGLAEATGHDADGTYVERLRVAARGTNWDDDVSFDMLLRNPAQQARVLAAHARKATGT